MPQIYSGRQQDQLFNAIGNRLVRRSNALEDDYTGDIHPEVRRVINEMHAAGLLSGLRYIAGPDGYGVSGPNRINRVREIVPGSGEATQGTAADQPELSRTDDRMNLALNSLFSGTGDPTGWSSSLNTDLVPGADGHQNLTFFDAVNVTQDVPLLAGQRLVFAVRIEVKGGSVSEVVDIVDVNKTVLESYRAMQPATAGEWLWVAVEMTAGGSAKFQITGADFEELSRPVCLYLPANWAELSASEKQQYLTDHYAASGPDHLEFPGFNGMRGITNPGASNQWLDKPGLPFSTWDAMTWLCFFVPHVGDSGTRRIFHQGVNQIGIHRIGSTGFRFGFRDSENNIINHDLLGAIEPLNQPVFLVASAKAGGQVQLYSNGELGLTSSAPASFGDGSDSEPLTLLSRSGTNYPITMFWAGVLNTFLDPSEVSTLNSILRGEP